ncbi:MAG TPA: GFA family protein [Myxococcaceae bacterium]|nr:GFA family protein [Myxococcaceae bacterium]
MGDTKTYEGGCHCGKVRYQVTTDLTEVVTCNCSICSRRGHALTFVPAGQFKLLEGESSLTDYQFNKKVIHHLFCRVCGVGSFGRGTGPNGVEMFAVNARCLDGVDLDALPLTRFDGKSL